MQSPTTERPLGIARRIDAGILVEALGRAAESGRLGVLVFDLDSTVLDNRPRQATILREFGARYGVAALEASAPEHWVSWDIRDAMRNAGMGDADIARWSEPAKEFWRERFFTSEYCRLDDPVAGAVDYLGRVRATRAQVVYCTGRHEAMRAGTVESFARLGLPLPGEGVHLLMKPNTDESDDAWKEQAYAQLRAIGSVLAAFDNEPTHINGYRAAFPTALMVHLLTDHSGRAVSLADGIVSVPNFVLPA